MENSEFEDKDDLWFGFTSHYVKKLGNSKGNWAALMEREQELAALCKLELDMYNGGFVQFFCNWGYDCYVHVLRCLERMEATQSLSIVKRQYSILEYLKDDSRVNTYWDIATRLADKESEKIRLLDEEYWDKTEDIVQKTLDTYKDMFAEWADTKF